MTPYPLFTIITPVYNRADCIIRCMESIARQNFDSYEFIIINDGSIDDTVQKIESMASKFIDFRLISYSKNRGVNFARNKGIEKAKGKYIIFVDSDDMLTENTLITIEKYINKYPNYSHYMFGVSDRIGDKALPSDVHEYEYIDWLSGKVSGDFAHVIQPSCFNGLMFLENFRIYESLNWLRVMRQNKRQFFIPSVILQRERRRADSVTRESILDNKISMQNTYNYLYQFIGWYGDDFAAFKLTNSLQTRIKKAYLLGIALGETNRNEQLIRHLTHSTMLQSFYRLVNRPIFSLIFYNLIKINSRYNQMKD